MPVILFLLALAAGVANPFQSGFNAELNKQLGRPLWTAIFIYASAILGLVLIQLFARQPLVGARVITTPWWAWLGGLISLISTVVGLTIAQRMGSGLFTGVSVTAALVTSVLLDQFGLIGFRQHPASAARIAGCALMVVGLWLIARF